MKKEILFLSNTINISALPRKAILLALYYIIQASGFVAEAMAFRSELHERRIHYTTMKYKRLFLIKTYFLIKLNIPMYILKNIN